MAFNFHYPPHTIRVNPTKVTSVDVLLTSLNHPGIPATIPLPTTVTWNVQYITQIHKTYQKARNKYTHLLLSKLTIEDSDESLV